jgi:hypothetical protein
VVAPVSKEIGQTGRRLDRSIFHAVNGVNLLVDNGFTAAILTNQADYSTMPAPDHLVNAAGS